MTRFVTNLVALILAIFGAVIALWLTVEHFLPQVSLPCGVVGDCQGALNSEFGHLGPIPTATFGVAMYAAIIALCLRRRRLLSSWRAEKEASASVLPPPETESASAEIDPAFPVANVSSPVAVPQAIVLTDKVTFGVALLGVGISWYLQYVALFVLFSFCPWCFTSACAITLILAVATVDYIRDSGQLTGEAKLVGAVLAFVVVLAGFIYLPQVTGQWKLIGRNEKPVHISIPRDRVIRNAVHRKGPENAKYLLVEYADYQCPLCKKSLPTIDAVLASHRDMAFAFRNYPIATHKWGQPAALVAEAASEQGKFWQMHDVLFQHQSEYESAKFKAPRLLEFAAEAGVDPVRLRADLKLPEVLARIKRDVADSKDAGVAATPTFFVVSPTQVWRFVGPDMLKQASVDTTHPMWK